MAAVAADARAGAAAPRPHLRHMPALDGMRGAAVVAVLLFHHDGLLRGGFLGVDLFFVLSGFLITSLLIGEVAGTGRVDLAAFWGRRFRRLMPALLVLLLGVAAFAALVADPSELSRIRADAFATLGYVANWQAISANHGYWQIFQAPSPLEHTWSLAIEEQFYVLWPLLVAGVTWLLARGGRSPRQRLAKYLFVGSLAGALASSALMWVLHTPGSDPSRVYMGTDTRASSILFGAALAGWIGWRGHGAPAGSARRAALEVAASVAAAGLAVAWVVADGQAPGMYRGGFLLCGLAAVLVIAAGAHPTAGRLGRLLSWRPLCRAGVLSYGLYLWHWPAYLVLDADRIGVDGPALLAVRVAASLALAVASYHVVETPVRRGRLRRVWLPAAVPAGLVACAVVVAVATTSVPVATANAIGPSASLPPSAAPSPWEAGAKPGAATATPGPERVLVVGDSVANSIASGAQAIQDGLGVEVANGAANGCALNGDITGVQLTTEAFRFEDVPLNPACLPTWRRQFDAFRPDVVTIVYGNAAAFEQFQLDGAWVSSCDAAYGTWYREVLGAAVADFEADGATVAIATLPYPAGTWEDAALRRIDCMNALNESVAAAERLPIVDVGGFVCPGGTCILEAQGEPMRPDGVHFGQPIGGDPANGFQGQGAEQVGRWLVDETLRVALE